MSEESTGVRQARLAELEAGDALRAWGVATVILFHLAYGVLVLQQNASGFRGAYGNVLGSLIEGVQANIYMFFALSAFLLARPYVRAALYPDARFPSTRRYVRHRIGRIVPAFWVTVVIVVIAYGMQGSSTGQLLAIFGFAQVYHHGQVADLIDHAWSIDVEALFYVLLVPLGFGAAWAMRRFRHGGLIAIAGIIVVVAIGAALDWHDPIVPSSQSPLGGLRSFVPGVALAILAVRFPGPDFWRRLPPYTSAILLVAGLFLSWRIPQWAPGGGSDRLYLGTLAGGLILAAAVVRQYSGGRMWVLLRGPVVQWVGERSFSIYLVHGVVFYALRNVGDGQDTPTRRLIVTLLVCVPAILAAAQVLFFLVERPAMLYARRRRPTDRGHIRPTAPDPLAPEGTPPPTGGVPAGAAADAPR
jgi:peptidoglycan/LPS O-acetylase OafA/YrhL